MLSKYSTLIFDCDGVILDSNRVKTDAFRRAALSYGAEAAESLVAYHLANGGVSRYVKFQYFLDEIVPTKKSGPDRDALLKMYSKLVWDGLLGCNVADGLELLRRANPDQRWMVVSGGDQSELRKIFIARGLFELFDGGVFGSPDTKDAILKRELEIGNICPKALFLGDSIYDHRAAVAAGLDFVFISAWSEVVDWQGYVCKHGIVTKKGLHEFIAH